MEITVNKMEREDRREVYGEGGLGYENKRGISVYVEVVVDNESYFK
ncbi:hypothetical protein [Bacillus altitudinis]|nr:hypothetical protein [Bacillus altitudinis]